MHVTRRKRVIVIGVGEKGVCYGNAYRFPRVLLAFVEACKAEYYDVTRGGLVVAYSASRRSFPSLERFLRHLEAVREILPDLGIGIAAGWGESGRFRWFSKKRRFPLVTIHRQAEEQALAGVQGGQTYRNEFEKLYIA